MAFKLTWSPSAKYDLKTIAALLFQHSESKYWPNENFPPIERGGRR